MFSCDLILLFSDFVPTAVDRYYLGYFYLSFLYIASAINVAMLVHTTKEKIKSMLAAKKQR